LSLPHHSVGTKQLKSKAVTKSKLANNAVVGAKVKDDSLTGADVVESSLGQVPSAAAADSATNASSLGGKPAANFISSAIVRSKALQDLANNTTVGGAADGGNNDGTVHCNAGEHAIGGGVRNTVSGKDQAVASSRPTDDTATGVPVDGTAATGWRTVVADQGTDATDNPTLITVFAICAS
jgi:hypothetical protein